MFKKFRWIFIEGGTTMKTVWKCKLDNFISLTKFKIRFFCLNNWKKVDDIEDAEKFWRLTGVENPWTELRVLSIFTNLRALKNVGIKIWNSNPRIWVKNKNYHVCPHQISIHIRSWQGICNYLFLKIFGSIFAAEQQNTLYSRMFLIWLYQISKSLVSLMCKWIIWK